jgi:hypothetical protein
MTRKDSGYVKKVKRYSNPVTGPIWPRGWVEVYLYSSMTSALEGGEWSAARAGSILPSGKDPVPSVQEAGWAPGPVWRGAENLAPTGFDPRTVQASSQSLNRLSYPAHIQDMY